MVRLAHEQKYSRVTNVLQNIEKNGMLNTVDKDEILLKVIKVVVQKSALKDACLLYTSPSPRDRG